LLKDLNELLGGDPKKTKDAEKLLRLKEIITGSGGGPLVGGSVDGTPAVVGNNDSAVPTPGPNYQPGRRSWIDL